MSSSGQAVSALFKNELPFCKKKFHSGKKMSSFLKKMLSFLMEVFCFPEKMFPF
jgi:hypothetical protein